MKILSLPTLRISFIGILVITSHFLSAQQFSAGINEEDPSPNAVLHLRSPNNNQGLLIPALSTSDRQGISLTARDIGLIVYDNDEDLFYFYDGVDWTPINTDNQDLAGVLANGADAGGVAITNVLDPTNAQDVATKNYVDNLPTQAPVSTDAGNLIAVGTDGGALLTNIDDADADASNEIQNLNEVLNEGASAGGLIITDAADPVNTQDVATKNYVDLNTLSETTNPATGDIEGNFQSGLNIATGVVSSLEIADGTITDDDINDIDVSKITGATSLDLDSTDDLALSTNPAAGDVSGNFNTGLTVDQVGGAASADIATTVTTVIGAASLDLDSTDDLALTTNPAAGDVSGDFSTGLTVDEVGGETATDIATAVTIVNGAASLDLDSTDDLALTTNPAAGDVSGNFNTGLTVDQVGGAASADIATTVTTVIGAASLDLDSTDDLALTTNPAAGDVSGDFSTGLTVDEVGGETAADIATAVTIVNGATSLDLDSTDDLALTTNPAAGDVSGDFSTGLTVDEVGGETAADIATAVTIVNGAASLDLDSTDDLALTTNPAAGDVSGDFSSGLTVDQVGGETAADIATAVLAVNGAVALDTDLTDDLALSTNVAAGDVSGNFGAGLTVNEVGGETATDIAAAVATVNGAVSLDLDSTDDLALTTNPAAGDVSGDFSTGLTVDEVGGETATDIAAAVVLVNGAASLDLDDSDDITTADVGTGANQIVRLDGAGALPGVDGSALTGLTLDLSGSDTDDLAEGTTNLYFTDARADARIAAANVTDLADVTNAGSGAIITGTERTNFTGAVTDLTTIATGGGTINDAGNLVDWTRLKNVPTDFSDGVDDVGVSDLTTFDTDDLTEGTTNLYFTDARADARIAAANVTDLADVTSTGSGAIITGTERTNFTGAVTDLTTIATGGGTLNDAGNLVDWTRLKSVPADFADGTDDVGVTNLTSFTTDNLGEGSTNLYFTDARADARIAAANVTDLADVTNAGSGAIITGTERTNFTGAVTDLTTIATGGGTLNDAGNLVDWTRLKSVPADFADGVDDVGISTTLADGNILIGNGSNIATAVAMTGDVSITNAGLTTLAGNAVGDAEVVDNITISTNDTQFTLIDDGSSNQAEFELGSLSGNRTYALPDAGGTVALISDITTAVSGLPTEADLDADSSFLKGLIDANTSAFNSSNFADSTDIYTKVQFDSTFLKTLIDGNTSALSSSNFADSTDIYSKVQSDSTFLKGLIDSATPDLSGTGSQLGIGTSSPEAALQIGDAFVFDNFENATEGIAGDVIATNLGIDKTMVTDNEFVRSDGSASSFIFFDNDNINFLKGTGGTSGTNLDLNNDVHTWLDLSGSGSVTMTSEDAAATSNAQGENVTIVSGNGDGTGAGGNINLVTGSGSSVGQVVLTNGNGVEIKVDDATAGAGAYLSIEGADAFGGSSANGGDISLNPGLGDGSGFDGSINLNGATTISGLNYPTSDGGTNDVLTTDGSGNLFFSTPSSGSVTNLTSDISFDEGANRRIVVNDNTTGSGDDLTLQGASAFGGSNGNGGTIVLAPGFGDGSGSDGSILMEGEAYFVQGAAAFVQNNIADDGGRISVAKSRDLATVEDPIIAGDVMGYYTFDGYDGADYVPSSFLSSTATDNFGSSYGSVMTVSTTLSGSSTVTDVAEFDDFGLSILGRAALPSALRLESDEASDLYLSLYANEGMSGDYDLIFPASAPAGGEVLSYNSGLGELEWTTPSTPSLTNITSNITFDEGAVRSISINANTTGTGDDLYISAGSASSGGNGGNIFLFPGAGDGAGEEGSIVNFGPAFFLSGANSSAQSNTAADGGIMSVSKARDNLGLPDPIQAGDIMGYFTFDGYDGTDYVQSSYISSTATDNFGSSIFGSVMTVFTTLNGESTPTNVAEFDDFGLSILGRAALPSALRLESDEASDLYLSLYANESMSGDYDLIFPANAPAGGEFLAYNSGLGELEWTTPSGASVTNLTSDISFDEGADRSIGVNDGTTNGNSLSISAAAGLAGNGGNLTLSAGDDDGSSTGGSVSIEAGVGNTDGTISLATGGAPQLVIDGAGNTGIGINTPSRELHLNGAGGISFQMTNGASAGTSATNGFVIDYNDTDQRVDFVHYEGADFGFGDGTTNLYVDNTNNRVGIGTNTPGSTLDVNGNANMGGILRINALVNTLPGGAENTDGFSADARIIYVDQEMGSGFYSSIGSGQDGEEIILVANTNDVTFEDADIGGGNIQLSNNGHLTLHANNTLKLIHAGGVWYELSNSSSAKYKGVVSVSIGYNVTDFEEIVFIPDGVAASFAINLPSAGATQIGREITFVTDETTNTINVDTAGSIITDTGITNSIPITYSGGSYYSITLVQVAVDTWLMSSSKTLP